MQEEWKLIEWSNGYYYISNMGRCKRESHIVIDKNGKRLTRKEKFLNPIFNKISGYYQYNIATPDRKGKKEYVHRLVAFAFVNNPNPELYDQVNHIDGDKGNNVYTNLEWVNEKLNMEHASKHGLINRDSEKRKKQAPINVLKAIEAAKKPTAKYDSNGDLIEIANMQGEIQFARLSYKGFYYRDVDILKSKYGEVPKHINVSKIKDIQNKKRHVYYAHMPNGETKTYYKLNELPITREQLWIAFSHDIPDKNGVVWDIQNADLGKTPKEEIMEIVEYVKMHTYTEASKKFGHNKQTISKWYKKYTQQ